MNKTILVVGGAAVASLAVGTAGGYFFAKKRFTKQTSEEVAREVEATKKYYSILLMQAKEQKPDSPQEFLPNGRRKYESETDYLKRKAEEDSDDSGELSPADRKAFEEGLAKVRANRREQGSDGEKPPLVDYGGISTEKARKVVPKKAAPAKKAVKAQSTDDAEESGLERHNIFADPPRTPKKALPPRDDVTGSFRKKTPREEEHEPPQIITAEEFLLNDPDYNQESLYYFAGEKTLVLQADPSEPVDRNLIGEVNLTLFPDVEEEESSMIYVRNDGMTTHYEVKLMTESLTDFIGLGTDEDGGNDGDETWV